MQPELIKDTVVKIASEIYKNEKGQKGVLEAWQIAVGRKIARHALPVSFKAGTLIVNVDRTAWLYELNLCKPLLLRRLKRKLPTRAPLRELKFRIGAVSPDADAKRLF